jgi:hypothetical protein
MRFLPRAETDAVEKRLRREIAGYGEPIVDVGVTFPSSLASTSLKIPAPLASAAGHAGIGIEVSIYCTGDD